MKIMECDPMIFPGGNECDVLATMRSSGTGRVVLTWKKKPNALDAVKATDSAEDWLRREMGVPVTIAVKDSRVQMARYQSHRWHLA